MSVAILAPILTEIGVPILKRVLLDRLPSGVGKDIASETIDVIADKIGVSPTPEAIKSAYETDPAGVGDALRQLEIEHADKWLTYLTDEGARRAELLAREDKEGFFYRGWRPALSWLLIWLFVQNSTLLPILNSAFGADIALTPWDQIVAFASIWLVIYGGGHTAKSIWGKK